MKFSTVFFDIDYCLLDTPASERRIIRELYARQGQQVTDEVGDTYREINKQLWVYLDAGQITRERLYLQETGIMEEILLENMHRNPRRNFTTWDALLYEKVKVEENIELLLNCACCLGL